MGRKRIHIASISSEKSRKATYAKRSRGLIKKAMELSILCNCEIALFMLDKEDIEVYSTDQTPIKTVEKALSFNPKINTNLHYESLFGGGDGDETDEADDISDKNIDKNELGGKLVEKRVKKRKKSFIGSFNGDQINFSNQNNKNLNKNESYQNLSFQTSPPPPSSNPNNSKDISSLILNQLGMLNVLLLKQQNSTNMNSRSENNFDNNIGS